MAREAQKDRSDALKQSIIDTALDIGLNEGFEAVSVRKIVAALRYSTTVVYYHFKNKQEIIDAVVERETERLNRAIRAQINESAGIVENIKCTFHAATMMAIREPETYNLVVLQKYSEKREAHPPWVDHLAMELERAMESGEVRNMDAKQTAFSLWSSFLGFNILLSLQTELAIEQADKMFEIQFDILMNGVLSREGLG